LKAHQKMKELEALRIKRTKEILFGKTTGQLENP
jgi:hypothetical protein